MLLPYRQVSDIYKSLKDAGAVTQDLPSWSSEMNRLSGTNIYDSGLNDNFVKRASVGVDRLLESTGFPNISGNFGAAVGSAVGNEQAGRDIGQGLPRMAVNFAPLALAGLVTGGAAPLAYAGGLAGLGALSGSETYANTGSGAAGLLSAATNVAMPGVANFAEKSALKALGGRIVEGQIPNALGALTNVEQRFGSVGQKVGSFLAGQGAAAGLSEASAMGQAGLDPNGEYNFSPTSALLNMTLGQLPFAAAHLAGKVVGREGSSYSEDQLNDMIKATRLTQEQQLRNDASRKSPIESVLDATQVPDPVAQAKIDQLQGALFSKVAELRQQKEALVAKGSPDDLSKIDDITSRITDLTGETDGSGVLGEKPTDDSPTFTVAGKTQRTNAKGDWQAVEMADTQGNREAGFTPGQIIGGPIPKGSTVTPDAEHPELNQYTFLTRHHDPNVVDNRAILDAAKIQQNPDLPLQQGQDGLEKTREQAADFSRVTDQLNSVSKGDAEGLRQALINVNGMRQKWGYAPLTDASIAEHQAKFGVQSPEDAAKGAMNDLMQRVALKEKLMQQRQVEQQKQVTALGSALDEEKAAGKSDLLDIMNATEAGRPGSFQKAFTQWTTDGQPGGIEGLRTRALKAKQQGGTGAPAIVQQTAVAAKEGSADTEAIRGVREATARSVAEGTMDDGDAQEFVSAYADGSLHTDPALKDFAGQSHIQRAMEEADQELQNLGIHPPQVSPTATVPAGDGWTHNLRPIEEVKGLPKTGVVPESRFRNIAAQTGAMSNDEVALYKQLAPEAFDGKGNVDVRKLYDSLAKNPPVVTTHVYGQEGKVSEAKDELDKMTHEWLEILPTKDQSTVRVLVGASTNKESDIYRRSLEKAQNELSPENLQKALHYNEVKRSVLSEYGDLSGPRATSYYNQISPFDTKKFPVVRIDVALPHEEFDPEGHTYPSADLWPADNLHENLPNTLGWTMGQVVPDPVTGEKVLFLGEVQSQWQQKFNKGETQQTHPLLPSQHVLVLKAALRYAAEHGIGKVVVSNGESAMMTEGHDKAVGHYITGSQDVGQGEHYATKEEAEVEGEKLLTKEGVNSHRLVVEFAPEINRWVTSIYSTSPSQASGMRQHYDKVLPSAMEKLTGEKGVPWDGGVHKNADTRRYVIVSSNGEVMAKFDTAQQAQQQLETEYTRAEFKGQTYSIKPEPIGSPIFKKPNGTPKTNADGLAYPVPGTKDFTLTNPSRVPGQGAYDSVKPFVPTTPEEKVKMSAFRPDDGGVAITRRLMASSDPQMAAVAKGLQDTFGESLKRTFVHILDMSREGFAQSVGNRETAIALSHGILMSNDPIRQEQVMLHELLHGLTLSELDNPTNVGHVQELEGVRQRLIDKLPSAVRAKYDSAQSSNWMNRFKQGQSQMAELGTGKWSQIVYGLLDNKELVSQGFSSPEMQDFMRSVKNPGSKINAFYSWVKSMIGGGLKVTDNEFAKFVDTTSQILNQGNWVSDIGNFTDNYFANKGMSPGVIREQSRRALELVQSSSPIASKQVMLPLLMDHPGASPEVRQTKAALTQMIQDKGEDYQNATQVLADLGHTPENIDNFLEEHLTQGVPDFNLAMNLLPKTATDYIFARAQDARDVLDSVRAATNAKNDGLTNLADPAMLRKPLAESIKPLDSVLRQQQEQALAQRQLGGIIAPPDAFFNWVLNESSRTPDSGTDEEKGLMKYVGDALGPVGKNISHFLEQPAQIARSNPLFAEWYSKIMLMPAKIRNMTSASMHVFGMDMDEKGNLRESTSKATLDKTYKALSSGPLLSKLNQLIYAKQMAGKESGTTTALDYNSPEFKKIASGLTEKEQQDLIELDNKVRLSKTQADAQSLETLRQELGMRAARLPMADEGMKLSPALDAAGRLFDALNEDFRDPQKAAEAQVTMQMVASKMQPASFANLLDFVKNSVEQHQLLATNLAQNPDWVTAKRMKDFTFEYFKGGKMVRSSADTMKEAVAETGSKDAVKNWTKNTRDDDAATVFGTATEDQIRRMRELEGNQIEALRARGATPEELATFQKMSIVSQVERDASFSGANLDDLYPPARGLSKGADQLPWFENHIDWIQKNASYWQRRLLRTTAESLRLEPGTAGTETSDLIKQHMEEYMQRDPAAGRVIQHIAATWGLGFNVATQIANSTQTFMRGVTELIAMGHGPLASVKEMTNAWGDLVGHKLEDKPYRGPIEEKFMRDALHDGMLDSTITDEQAQANELSAVNFKRIINKEKPKTIGQHATSALGAYGNAGMFLFRHGEFANNKAQLLATFRTLQKLKPDMSYADMKKQAYLVNASVNDVGGRANRPLGLYSAKSDFGRTVAMSAASLQSYMLGSTFQMIRNLKNGAFRPSGLTPAEVYSARKAAIYQLGVQFAAAGTLGMPFVSGALALLDQAFPNLEVNKKLRESVAGLFGTDSQDGHILSDIAMSGIPSMMGWDFSSRLNAGNLLPGVSEYNGFQPEQLLGVPASMITNFVKGATGLIQGNPGGGYAFVPPAFKKLAELAGSGGQLRDYQGRPTIAPSVGETAGLALGFQPKRLSDYNAASRMANASEHLAVVRAGQQNQQLAEETLKGNFGTVRSALQQQMQADKSYNPVDAVRAIARAAEEQTFPKDLRREGSRQDMDMRKRLLNSFSLDPSAVSEVARFQFRQGIERRLGLNSPDVSGLRQAQLMDQLRQQDPNATRSALAAAATEALRRTASRELAPVGD